MRSRLRDVSAYLKPGQRPSYLLEVLEAVEDAAGELSAPQLLEAIGRAARLEAVLRARYASSAMPASPSPEPGPQAGRYLTAADAGTYLGVSKSTVLRLAKAGALPARYPSAGTVRFAREDLDHYMATERPAPKP